MTVPCAIAAERIDLVHANLSRVESTNAALMAANQVGMTHTRHERALDLDPSSRLVLLRRHSDGSGRNYRYQQTFLGIPVFGENVVVSEDAAGNIRGLFGRTVLGLESEIPAGSPRLSNNSAFRLGLQSWLGEKRASARIVDGKSELVIYVDDENRAHKAYAVSYFANNPSGTLTTRPVVIVDAENGRILKQWENLQSALVGTGPGGNAKTGQYEYGTTPGYGKLDVTQSGTTCTMNNAKVKTVNMNGGTTNTAAFAYTCPRNTVKNINGAYSPLNDGHYFAGKVYDMYMAYFGRKPLTFQIVMNVHYKTNYENAFWDGSTLNFGDGASTFYPFTGADVVGHEISHGFTEQNSGLTYVDQSGGINEAFSDMAGEATEYYMRGSNDFKVGYDITKGTGALRYMSNPPQDGKSIGNANDFIYTMDVHYSSGVYNKAFYNLATKPGWSTQKAFKLFATANDLYWTPSTNFYSGLCGVRSAATNLGYSAAEVNDVNSAFSAVGITSCTPPSGTKPVISNMSCDLIGFKYVCSVTYTSNPNNVLIGWNTLDGTNKYPCSPNQNLLVKATVSNRYGTSTAQGNYLCPASPP
jgi:pseudolysin/vibriolysin